MVWEMDNITTPNRRVFSDLPNELIHKILYHSVFARGVVRALRSRLVCKLFASEASFAIFETRLLDSFRFRRKRGFPKWFSQTDHGASRFWHSYLVYKVQADSNTNIRPLLDIRIVAEAVCSETGGNLAATLENLCWPTLRHEALRNDSEWQETPQNIGLDLLCAAAYLNLIPLAERLLQEGLCLSDKSPLFSSPMRLAACSGNASMLQVFQEHTPELKGIEPGCWPDRWKGKAGPESIRGAIMRGDLDMIRLAIYPPSRAKPNSTDFNGEKFGQVSRRGSVPGNLLDRAQFHYAKTPQVHKYLETFFHEPAELPYALALHSRWGDFEMARHLLDSGADINGVPVPDGHPLTEACRSCHEDIVDLLLERGADPNFCGVLASSTVAAAAAGGSLAIVRKLLARGADLSSTQLHYAILRAVRLEHTAMLELFLTLGPELICSWEYYSKFAMKEGLESMAEIFKREGLMEYEAAIN